MLNNISHKLLLVTTVIVLVLLACDSSLAKLISVNSLRQLHKPVSQACYSYDGINVNKKHPTWGSTGEAFPRLSKPVYVDGVKSPPRTGISARVISNAFCKQTVCDSTNAFNVSAMLYAWGQFVDHDTNNQATGLKFTENFPIEVPPGDVFTQPLPFTRSVFSSAKPTYIDEPVNQVNFVTGYMDCSQMYGSDETRALAIREMKAGLLKVDLVHGKEFVPKSFLGETGLFFLGAGNNTIIAGDVRATESLPISIMQTLFLREHNRLARALATRFNIKQSKLDNDKETDEELYQTARSINCAQIQAITYKEYLPRLLGSFSPKPERIQFDPEVKTTTSNEFVTAAYRFGHSMVSCDLKRIAANYTQLTPIDFAFAFNAYPTLTQSNEELDFILRGLIKEHSQNLDEKIVDGLREVVRGRLDLAARNIQRGRDHGLPDYNTIRKAVGLPTVDATQITTNTEVRDKLIQFFGNNLNNLEPWLGILVEEKLPTSQLGALGTKIIADQFTKFVKGDPCFYTNSDEKWIRDLKCEIDKVTLADIIVANTGISANDKTLGNSPFEAKYTL
ncbi:hypothetical protein ABK040_000739 [Willaertia magna]